MSRSRKVEICPECHLMYGAHKSPAVFGTNACSRWRRVADQFTYPWGEDWKRHWRVPRPTYKTRRFRADVRRLLERVISGKQLSAWDTDEAQGRLF